MKTSSRKSPRKAGVPRQKSKAEKESDKAADRPQAKILKVDQRCMSCSTQAHTVMSAFKIACLQYNPTPIKYQDEEYKRQDLLTRVETLLARADRSYRQGAHGSGAQTMGAGFREAADRQARHGIAIPTQAMAHTFHSLAEYMPLMPGELKQEKRWSKRSGSREGSRGGSRGRLPTVVTSRPNSLPGTPRDGTRDIMKTRMIDESL